MRPSTRFCIRICAAADGLRKAVLAVAAEAAESLAADFVECLTLNSGGPWLPSLHIFRPQNCGAVAHTLSPTGPSAG